MVGFQASLLHPWVEDLMVASPKVDSSFDEGLPLRKPFGLEDPSWLLCKFSAIKKARLWPKNWGRPKNCMLFGTKSCWFFKSKLKFWVIFLDQRCFLATKGFANLASPQAATLFFLILWLEVASKWANWAWRDVWKHSRRKLGYNKQLKFVIIHLFFF